MTLVLLVALGMVGYLTFQASVPDNVHFSNFYISVGPTNIVIYPIPWNLPMFWVIFALLIGFICVVGWLVRRVMGPTR